MNKTLVQFLYFEGCPLAPRALENLTRAIDSLPASSAIQLEKVDLQSGKTPVKLKRWGSPTILVNGRDITGTPPGDSLACRLYSSKGGVPSVEEIAGSIGP